MKRLRLEIIGMSYSQSQSGAYALILGEVGGKRRLPIIIGGFEAQSIAIELEKMKPSRPLTHDLFKSFAENYKINIREVVIDKFHEGIFFAKLVCEHDGESTEIDARTSDAVALAIRFHCPIYTYEKIMTEAGILMDENIPSFSTEGKQEEATKKKGDDLKDVSLNDLHELLQKAVEAENYERASIIRDEIQRRKKS